MKTLNAEKFQALSTEELVQTNGGGLIDDLFNDAIAGVSSLVSTVATVAVNVALNLVFNITNLLGGIKI